ncbi:putative G-protein coupled receptor No9 [Oratosquilla oratoria]|uniref:putative G-protein coupled receptor No9 n=1 Tax=Oratosquilla oratoria TaxID=337810 RepID=UPI003F761879
MELTLAPLDQGTLTSVATTTTTAAAAAAASASAVTGSLPVTSSSTSVFFFNQSEVLDTLDEEDVAVLGDLAADGGSLGNSPNCSSPLAGVDWQDVGVITSLVALGILNVLVICGNCLVILAVFLSSKLRTVTNLFIVSLAVADLLLGVAVLPFSVTIQAFDVWLYGDLWCSVWLAVDVWMSTASILNLCAISLDRYVAVTRPVSYPSLMSSSRAKLLIAGVWVTSFVICFPPLVGWNDRHKNLVSSSLPSSPSSSSSSSVTFSSPQVLEGEEVLEEGVLEEDCQLTCELTNEIGYVVYSALGSFFIPMFVMLFFYWKIYRSAIETTRAINQGFRTTRDKSMIGRRFEEQRLTLRIHRGRGSMQDHQRGDKTASLKAHAKYFNGGHNGRTRRGKARDKSAFSSNGGKKVNTPPPCHLYSVHYSHSRDNNGRGAVEILSNNHNHNLRGELDNNEVSAATGLPHHNGRASPRCRLAPPSPLEHTTSLPLTSPLNATTPSNTSTPSCFTSCDNASTSSDESKPKFISKMGRRNIKAQVKRFRMETKAAKTLGIIVGVFILCWLPFFTMYVVRGFCPHCIHPLLFSILFWLGYCNSALNPCIYALFSKDFRFAFKKILCKCICTREKKDPGPVINPQIYLSSFGDDSEGANDDSK